MRSSSFKRASQSGIRKSLAIAAALALSGVGLMTAAAGAIETDECPPADTAEVRGGAIGAPGTPVCDEPEPTPKPDDPGEVSPDGEKATPKPEPTPEPTPEPSPEPEPEPSPEPEPTVEPTPEPTEEPSPEPEPTTEVVVLPPTPGPTPAAQPEDPPEVLPRQLARTGSENAPMALIGGGLILGGIAIVSTANAFRRRDL